MPTHGEPMYPKCSVSRGPSVPRVGMMVCAVLCSCTLSTLVSAQTDDLVARVNGEPIRASDLRLEAILRRIPADQIDAHREALIDQLIDQRLIDAFLRTKRVSASPLEIDGQVERIHALIRRRGDDPQELLQRLSLNEDQLRNRLAQALAWTAYVQRITPPQDVRAYFDAHQRELDGTQVRAAHIVLLAAANDEAARTAARTRLLAVRRAIDSGEQTFATAAAEVSDGPSAQNGGDVGFFAFRGTMPAEFADAAFALAVGEISQPIDTPFGVHLIHVVEERPGQLSLEDVRPELLDRIARQLRSERLALDRPQARIERTPAAAN